MTIHNIQYSKRQTDRHNIANDYTGHTMYVSKDGLTYIANNHTGHTIYLKTDRHT